MLTDLLSRLFGADTPDTLPDTDARLALTALLVRLAKADGIYDVTEIQRIDAILTDRYGLNAVSAAQLRAQAEDLEHQAPDTVRFTRAIKDAVPLEARVDVVEALWQVALADGSRDPEEDALLRMVAPMLGLTDPQSAEARQRAQARQSPTPGKAG